MTGPGRPVLASRLGYRVTAKFARKFLGREAKKVVRRGHPDRRVVRVVRLDDHAAGTLAAACPTCNLRHKLERPLRGPEVWDRERRVGSLLHDRPTGIGAP